VLLFLLLQRNKECGLTEKENKKVMTLMFKSLAIDGVMSLALSALKTWTKQNSST